MKVNSLTRYQYTGDVMDFRDVGSTDGVGTTRQYFFSRNVKLKLFFGSGDGPVVYCPEGLRVGQRLRNLRTVDGELIKPDPTSLNGFEYEISISEPVLNGFGFQDSYRYDTTRV